MCHPSGIQEVAGWILRLASCLSYWFSHEIISESILSLPVIQVWMDELGFYVPSTLFQSFRDDGRVNMKGSVQWSAV